MSKDIFSFVELIRSQFSAQVQSTINENTDIKTLKEWSSLQTMIIVNEIDKEFGVVLDVNDLKSSDSVEQLYKIVKSKKS